MARNEKGARVAVEFIDGNGEACSRPTADVQQVKVTHVATGKAVTLDLAMISGELLTQLAAQGASVLLRNEVNTTPDEAEAVQKLVGRYEALQNGEYYADGTRTYGTPLVIQAVEIAFTEKFSAKVGAEKKAVYLEQWNAHAGDKKAQDKARRAIGKKLLSVPLVQAAYEALHAAKAKPAKALGLDEI